MNAVEKLYPLQGIRDLIPTRPSVPTIYRWASRGVKGVILETRMVGGRKFVSQEQLTRFFSELDSK